MKMIFLAPLAFSALTLGHSSRATPDCGPRRIVPERYVGYGQGYEGYEFEIRVAVDAAMAKCFEQHAVCEVLYKGVVKDLGNHQLQAEAVVSGRE